ncbi:unnamed protein product [marine sediment metagenome]|uniref:Uncharacterized protein n=1 Tax=marine sediment metagenome TaxID=412755 RepID=X1N508_9ZZZZ
MKAIRRHLKRAQAHLNRSRGHLLSARRLVIAKGCGSSCIAATTKALADNHLAHEDIDQIANLLEATNPHYKPSST